MYADVQVSYGQFNWTGEFRPAVIVEDRSKWYIPTFPIVCSPSRSGLSPCGRSFLCSVISGTTPASGFPPPSTLAIRIIDNGMAVTPLVINCLKVFDIVFIVNLENWLHSEIFVIYNDRKFVGIFFKMRFDTFDPVRAL